MVKIIKKFSVLLFIIIVLINSKAYASMVIDSPSVDSNKKWTIKFTDNISFDDLTKNAIKLQNDKMEYMNVTCELGSDGKSIIVNAPSGGYTPGEFYTLSVGTDVHSVSGRKLKEQVILSFGVDTVNKTVPCLPIDYNNVKTIKLCGSKGGSNASAADSKQIIDWINSIKIYEYREICIHSCPPPKSSIYIQTKDNKYIDIAYGYNGCREDTVLISDGYYVKQPELLKYMSKLAN